VILKDLHKAQWHVQNSTI